MTRPARPGPVLRFLDGNGRPGPARPGLGPAPRARGGRRGPPGHRPAARTRGRRRPSAKGSSAAAARQPGPPNPSRGGPPSRRAQTEKTLTHAQPRAATGRLDRPWQPAPAGRGPAGGARRTRLDRNPHRGPGPGTGAARVHRRPSRPPLPSNASRPSLPQRGGGALARGRRARPEVRPTAASAATPPPGAARAPAAPRPGPSRPATADGRVTAGPLLTPLRGPLIRPLRGP